jgi:glycosyltransferase involved in cell wall biosynthesis
VKRLRIFIAHASERPTNYMPHGDGLLAYRYIEELAARGHRLVIASEGHAIHGQLPANITFIETGLRSRDGRVAYMRRLRQLYHAEQDRSPFDLVHQLNPVFCGLSLALFGTRTSIVLGPYVTSWPTSAGKRFRSALIQRVRRMEQARAAALILAGAQARSNVFSPRTRQVIIPYGIDTKVFSPRPMPPPTAPPTIIFMGPIAHRKGIITLIHAFARVKQRLPQALLRIAGTGEEFDEMSATIDRSGLRANVEVVGSIPRAEVPEYLTSGHLFAQPSVGEPYGMGAVEAMAVGRPIVATAAGGYLDTVDERGGRLVPVNDVNRLADALLEVLTEPGLALEMGTYNGEKAKRYDWTRVIDEIEELYRSVLGDRLIQA